MQTHLTLLNLRLSSNLIARIPLFKNIARYLFPGVLLDSYLNTVTIFHFIFSRPPAKGHFVCPYVWQHCSTAVYIVMAAVIDV